MSTHLGTFHASRFRLFGERGIATVFGQVAAHVDRDGDAVRLEVEHGGSESVARWLSKHPLGSELTVQCWAPLQSPAGNRQQWSTMSIPFRLDQVNGSSFRGKALDNGDIEIDLSLDAPEPG